MDSTCVVDGCSRNVKVLSRGLCNTHYQRFMKRGTFDLPGPRITECELNGCARPQHGQGMCSTHLSRIRRTGTASGEIRMRVPVRDRFQSLITKTESCWLFSSTSTTGYGYFHWDGHPGPAHRYSYEVHVGPIPDGLQIDHLCRVRACVNPDHLEPVTPWENTMRSGAITAINARKTHCLRGHPFSDENTYYSRDGRRYCNECRRIHQQARGAKQKWVGSNN